MDSPAVWISAITGLVTIGLVIFTSGRVMGYLRSEMNALSQRLEKTEESQESKRQDDKVLQEERQRSTLLVISHLQERVDDMKEAMIEKRVDLQTMLERQLTAMTSEITSLRADRHNTTGTVMRHEGAIGDLTKQVTGLDSRLTRTEDILRVRHTDFSLPQSPPHA